MKLVISSTQLEILRKAVYGLSQKEIAAELKMSPKEVDKSLKGVMKTTGCKEPMEALQNLAKNGFQLSD